MRMYDYLNNISRNIEQNQVDMKKSQEHQKRVEYVKNELDAVIFAQLQDKQNIFSDNVKDYVIDSIINNTDLILYNVDYTRQYLNKRYYTVARQVEQIQKKQNTFKNDDYKKQLAYAKFEWQKQKDLQKMQLQTQKEAEKQRMEQLRRQQIRQQQINNILAIVGKILVFTMKATIYMILAPFFIVALFFGGFVGGMIKLK